MMVFQHSEEAWSCPQILADRDTVTNLRIRLEPRPERQHTYFTFSIGFCRSDSIDPAVPPSTQASVCDFFKLGHDFISKSASIDDSGDLTEVPLDAGEPRGSVHCIHLCQFVPRP